MKYGYDRVVLPIDVVVDYGAGIVIATWTDEYGDEMKDKKYLVAIPKVADLPI